jgi:predicted nucleic acid-binding protein
VPPTLIDTNVLVYTFDQNEPARQQQAIEVLRALEQSGDGRLSVQCLAEFCAVAMRRLRPPLSPEATLAQVERFQRAFAIYSLTPMIVTEALRGVRTYQLSYYDAQIWATARLNQVPRVFREDFNPSTLEGVQFINPFHPGFAMSH